MTDSPKNSLFSVLDLDVDLAQRRVSRGGEALVLPDLSFRLLATLIEAAPHTVDKDTLIEKVWDGVVVSDETLSQRVRLLRQALGEEGSEPRYMESVRGRGYRMICPVMEAAPPEAKRQHWLVIGVAAVLALVVGLLLDRPSSTHSIDSVAVLPFADLSPGQTHGYFADGMQEELLTRLAQLDGLHVASRTSVERFRGTEESLPDIARELRVDAVIESSVRVAGDRVRITVQLIDADSDGHLWAENYDRELSVANIFAIQQDVAARIGDALALTLGQGKNGPPTDDLAAYDDYLLGRHHTFRQTPEDLAIAIERLESAVERDPEFAEAWATLGWAYSFAGTMYGRQPPTEVYPKAKAAVTRALAIDNQLSDARTLYADILTWYDWDFVAAEREYEKTMELNPLNVLGYALFLSVNQRHEEAIALIERRLEANPEDPYVHINAAWIFLRAGDNERALAEALLAPKHSDSALVQASVHRYAGDAAKAVEILERVVRERGRQPRYLSQLAVAYVDVGREADARTLLLELKMMAEARYLSPDLIANVHFALGELNEGFAGYRVALDDRSRIAIFLPTTSTFNGLRDDPRYQALMERVGL